MKAIALSLSTSGTEGSHAHGLEQHSSRKKWEDHAFQGMIEFTNKDLKDIAELKQIHCKDSLQAKIRSAQKKAKSSMLRAQKEKCKRLNEGK